MWLGVVWVKVSKRARRRQKVLAHLAQAEGGTPLVRPVVREPFYLPDLGLRKACFDDWSVHRELPPVIRRGRVRDAS